MKTIFLVAFILVIIYFSQNFWSLGEWINENYDAECMPINK